MIEIKLQGVLKTLNTKTDQSFEENGVIFYLCDGNISFQMLLKELRIPSDYIAFVLINDKRHIKDKQLIDTILSNGDRLEIFPLIAAG